MSHVGLTLALAASILCSGASAGSAAVVVTACGQEITGEAVLAADLDCSAATGTGVILREGASLDLSGFTVYGGTGDAVSCDEDCIVEGAGGRITGASGCGVRLAQRGTLTVRNVTLDDNAGWGACARNAEDELIGAITLENVTVERNRFGVTAKHVTASASTVTESEIDGISCGRRCDVRYCVVRHNGARGVRSYDRGRITVVGSDVSFNGGYGVEHAKVIHAVDSVISWNWFLGTRSTSVRLTNTALEQNHQAPECGTDVVCADIISVRKPRLEGGQCEKSGTSRDSSGHWVSGWPYELVPWGVCSLD